MPPLLEIHCLGGLRLVLDGEALPPVGARSAEAALVYVALQPLPVTRGLLTDLIWPGHPEEAARASLRAALHRLRRQLGPLLVTSRSNVRLDEEVYVDALEFESLLRGGLTSDAAALYRGEFLAGFHYDGSGAFEEWAVAERERLRQRAIAAYEELLARHDEAGEAERALESARRLIGLEPLHEPAHRAAMRLLAGSGRRSAALRHFADFRRHLAEEMGLEPDERTARLAERLRAGGAEEADAPGAAERSAPASIPTVSGAGPVSEAPPLSEALREIAHLRAPGAAELPTFTTRLVGREVELRTLQRRLSDPDCRWLTVVGIGGAGKTRLAVEAALRSRPLFEHGVRFLPLAGVASQEHLLPTLARLLDIEPSPRFDLSDQLAAYLRDKRLLLVLDNLEQLAEGLPPLAALLMRSPGVKVLATSRERLHLPEEWLLPLAGLEAPEEAEALFVLHAAKSAPGFSLEADAKAVADICAAVEGLPLALELAASWGNALPLERIAAELAGGVTLLAAAKPGLPTRQRSMLAVFDASWELLPSELSDAFARLGPFRGGFTAEHAAEVAEVGLPQLLALADRSLLRPARGGRFEMHELLRRYAQARLDESGQAQEVARRHLAAYTRLAERVAAEVAGAEPGIWLRRLASEQDNVRAALEWALSGPETSAAAATLLDAMAWFWRLRCDLREGRSWLERGLSLGGLEPQVEAALRHQLGHICWMADAQSDAERELSASLGLLAELGEAGELRAAIARCSLAMVGHSTDDLARAASLLDEAQAVFRARGASWWLAFAHGWAGKVAAAAGERQRAREQFRLSLEIFRSLGSAWGEGLFSETSADLLFAEGDIEEAWSLAERSAILLEEVGFKHSLWATYRLLGYIASRAGDGLKARAMLTRALEICRDIGHQTSARQLEEELRQVSSTVPQV